MMRGCIHEAEKAPGPVLNQPADGYRYCLDPFLLADFSAPNVSGRILDMGCGVGVAGLVVAWLREDVSIIGVEIQERLFEYARRNVEESGLADRVELLHGDFQEISRFIAPGSVSAVISNPPFLSPGACRVSEHTERAIARNGICGGAEDVITSAADMLEPGGKIFLVYPAHRWEELSAWLKDADFKPRRVRFVHPRCESESYILLVEAELYGGERMEISDPLIIYDENDAYTHEVGKLFAKISPQCY